MEKDPNTIWKSAYIASSSSSSTTHTTKVDGKSSKMNFTDSKLLKTNANAIECARKLHKTIHSFWNKYSVEFSDLWQKLQPLSRENFLREIQPCIVQSLADRYTILNGKKQYERRYDTLLLLSPIVTVEYMMAENNFLDCFEKWAKEDVLAMESSEIVVNLRQLYADGLYPFQQSDLKKYKEELLLKKGDQVVISALGREFGQFSEINDPTMIKVSSTKVEGTDFEVNLYRMGIISHPAEFFIVLENMHFNMYLFSNAIDEFRDEILGKNGSKMVSLSNMFVCANCLKTETDEGQNLKSCSKCKLTFYCSKSCQSEHWKSNHRKECPEIIATHWDKKNDEEVAKN